MSLPPGPGRPKGYRHATITKNRIKAGKLMDYLYKTAIGEHEMTQTQISAALGFLRKVVPDLKAIEHSGQVTHRHVEELSDAELLEVIARSRDSSERVAATASGQGDDGSVH